MRKLSTALLGLALAGLAGSPVHAQGTVKIGLIMAYSGQFADTAAQMDNAIKLYMKQNGDMVAGRKIEIIRKDTGGPKPDVAKRLAQELVTRDHVDIIAGFTLTPEALGAADISAQAKKFMVVMNAATSIITEKSPVGSVRMAVANPDFSAYVQKAKDVNPDAVFIFIPGGAQPPAMAKAMQERGFPASKIIGQGEVTMDDNALKSMGDAALGIRTVFHYSWEHKSKMNAEFVKAYEAEFHRHPDVFSIGGWTACT